MRHILFCSLALAGCATGEHNLSTPTAPSTGVAATPVARTPLEPADRAASRIRAEVEGAEAVQADGCVRASGKVRAVGLESGPVVSTFELPVIDDVLDWQFVPLPGPDSLRTCQLVKIDYPPRS